MNVNQSVTCRRPNFRGGRGCHTSRRGAVKVPYVSANQRQINAFGRNRSYSSNSSDIFRTPNTRHRSRSSISDSSLPPFASPSLHTSTSSNFTDADANHTIIALCEGRGLSREEVGMAAFDLRSPVLGLYQVSDTQGFIKTFTVVQMLDPVEILVPLTLSDSRLVHMLKERFRTVAINSIPRRWYDGNVGLQQLHHLCAQDYTNSLLNIQHKYYALAATAALVRQLEHVKQIAFAAKSLKVVYLRTEQNTAIDCDTAYRLELVASTRGSNKYASLLGILNHCATHGGYRLLRASILQPLCIKEMIIQRQSGVEELIHSPDLLTNIKSILYKFVNVDCILTLCMKTPRRDGHRSAELQLNYILILKTLLSAVPALVQSLDYAHADTFVRIREQLTKLRYEQINDHILRIIHKDAHPCKGHIGDIQRCFAVQAGINQLLDLSRTIYSDLVDNVREIVKKYTDKYNLPLTLSNSTSKGFHIVMKIQRHQKGMRARDFPPKFINVVKSTTAFTMTTHKLIELNQRLKNTQQEIEILSNTIICNLLNEIRADISSLYHLCECVAELDLIQSLAQAGSIPRYIKPQFTSYMEVEGSRHPMLEYLSERGPIGNDIFATENHNFHIITGPNMSGKSIYIRQIALVQIMAQMGAFVPADKACLRITDRIFARINFDDSIESDASTFQLDIREMKIILDMLTPTSLVIIDELCRGTVHDEGTAMAWALAEQFLNTTAYVFFTTHFITLTKLEDMYFNVTNWHMEANEVNINGEVRLRYTYRLLDGVTMLEKYGLAAARASAMPRFIVKRASELIDRLQPTVKPIECILQHPDLYDRFTYNFLAKIKIMLYKNELDPELYRDLITQFRETLRAIQGQQPNVEHRNFGNIVETQNSSVSSMPEYESNHERLDPEDNLSTQQCDSTYEAQVASLVVSTPDLNSFQSTELEPQELGSIMPFALSQTLSDATQRDLIPPFSLLDLATPPNEDECEYPNDASPLLSKSNVTLLSSKASSPVENQTPSTNQSQEIQYSYDFLNKAIVNSESTRTTYLKESDILTETSQSQITDNANNTKYSENSDSTFHVPVEMYTHFNEFSEYYTFEEPLIVDKDTYRNVELINDEDLMTSGETVELVKNKDLSSNRKRTLDLRCESEIHDPKKLKNEVEFNMNILQMKFSKLSISIDQNEMYSECDKSVQTKTANTISPMTSQNDMFRNRSLVLREKKEMNKSNKNCLKSNYIRSEDLHNDIQRYQHYTPKSLVIQRHENEFKVISVGEFNSANNSFMGQVSTFESSINIIRQADEKDVNGGEKEIATRSQAIVSKFQNPNLDDALKSNSSESSTSILTVARTQVSSITRLLSDKNSRQYVDFLSKVETVKPAYTNYTFKCIFRSDYDSSQTTVSSRKKS